MNINISLNTKSLNEAIKQLKNVRNKVIPKIIQTYLKNCCKWVENRANIYLEQSGVGDEVISDIQKSANIILNGNMCTLRYGEKAAFIEFGVGLVGKGTYKYELNPNLQGEWQYDTETSKKLSDRSWVFNIENDETIDIKEENIINRTENTIKTKGNQATMFLYQAAMDFKSTGEYKKKWEEIKKEYLK